MKFFVLLASAFATQLPAPVASDEVRVATSALHMLVIAPDGRVLCQGRNQYGVCGADQATAFVETLSPVPGIPRGREVAVGAVAFRDGSVRTWGSNSFGSPGTGGGVDAVAPRGVLVRTLSGIVRVWAGVNRVLARKSDGTLYLWGPAGTAHNRVLRVPTVMTTFAVSAPRKP